MPEMNSRMILEVLRAQQVELRARGVSHASLFGSVARGTETSESDIDIVIDLVEDAQIGIYEYVAIKAYINGLFPVPVDVVNRDALKPTLSKPVDLEEIRAF